MRLRKARGLVWSHAAPSPWARCAAASAPLWPDHPSRSAADRRTCSCYGSARRSKGRELSAARWATERPLSRLQKTAMQEFLASSRGGAVHSASRPVPAGRGRAPAATATIQTPSKCSQRRNESIEHKNGGSAATRHSRVRSGVRATHAQLAVASVAARRCQVLWVLREGADGGDRRPERRAQAE